jgi:hypothetical protein
LFADWRVHDVLPPAGNGVLAEPNQQAFQAILDSSSQFTDHGVIALQHDIYIESVNLAIGYTLPYLTSHTPPFDIKPVMECQGRPIGDMYNETNSNHDGPWYGTGDVATRSSNVGFDEISSVPSVSRAYVSTATATGTGTGTGTGTSTHTGTSGGGGGGGGTGAGERNGVSAALVVLVAVVGVVAGAL